MSTDTSSLIDAVGSTEAPERATRRRVAILAISLAAASVVAPVAGIFWPSPSGGGQTYSFADIADHRDLWWGLLTGLSLVAIVTVLLQSLAAMLLVRRRGSTWVTIGGLAMWLGVLLQGIGSPAGRRPTTSRPTPRSTPLWARPRSPW